MTFIKGKTKILRENWENLFGYHLHLADVSFKFFFNRICHCSMVEHFHHPIRSFHFNMLLSVIAIHGLLTFLQGTIDFRYNGALSPELSNDHPNMHIIHRKVALILGQWVSEVK